MIPKSLPPLPEVSSMPMTSEEFIELKNRVKVLEIQVTENTALTQKGIKIAEETRDSTRDLVIFSERANALVDAGNWLIKFFKPFAIIGLAFVALAGVWTAGKSWLISAIQSGQIK